MKYYVILSYPKLSESDYKWIQGIRRVNDSLFDAVEPHFTLVFPFTTEDLAVGDLIRHVEAKVQGSNVVHFTFVEAKTEQNHFPAYSQTHLVVSKGADEITQLHDLLYADAGVLTSQLRSDIPYVPHVTVANQADQIVTQKLSETINREGIAINGLIDTVTVGMFDGKKVANLKAFALH